MKPNALDAIQQAEKDVLHAEKEQYIGGYSLSRDASNIQLLQGPLAKAICERLAALQYLSQHDIDDKLEQAQADLAAGRANGFVHQFESAVQLMQREAGLKEDAWLSSKTYDALHNVFSFEDPTDLDHWTQPPFRHFFNRALYARLNVLGLVPQPAVRFFTLRHAGENQRASQYANMHFAVETCLSYFEQVTQFLGLSSPPFNDRRFALSHLLFDTDGLTQQLANKQDHIIALLKQVVRPARWSKPSKGYPKLTDAKLPALSLRFLMAQARIETWLNGYGSEIKDGDINAVLKPTDDITTLNYSRSLVPGLSTASTLNSVKLGNELKRKMHFWEDAKRLIHNDTSPRNISHATRNLKREIKNKEITFASVALRTIHYANALNAIEIHNEEMDVSALNEAVSKLDDQAINAKAWKRDHSASLLDGVKRAWRWVVNKAKAVIGFFVDKLRLIIRAVKSVAVQGFSWFKKLGVIFASAVKHVVNKDWYNSESILMARDTDFDLVTHIKPQTPIDDVNKAVTHVQQQTHYFRAAVALTKLILKALGNIKNILINPIWGSIKAMLMLVNFNQLFSSEDKQYINSAFAALASS